MDDFQLDTKLKELLRKQELEIPEVIRVSIDRAFERLPGHKNRINRWYYITASVLILGILFSSVAFTPATVKVFQKIPLVGSVFQKFDDVGLKIPEEKNAVCEAKESATDQGITIKVTEVFYDGKRFAIGYIEWTNYRVKKHPLR